MKPSLFSIFIILLCAWATSSARAAVQPFSQYGQIQNVQNYSSNPFWNPNGPYNQRLPQPVYVQGADLNTGDCQRTVSALVASECAARNNCVGVTLSDVRPNIILQLSRLPGHNFATACAGYIDAEFDAYVRQHATAGATAGAAFPAATTPNPTVNAPTFKFENPYEPKVPTWNGTAWPAEIKQREQELQELQSRTGTTPHLVRADFPTTAADLTFQERMDNAAAGYAPFKDKSAYKPLNIESEEAYRARQAAYCQQKMAPLLATLDADLATLNRCKTDGVKYKDCLSKLQGRYYK